jgi:hypothetical protein
MIFSETIYYMILYDIFEEIFIITKLIYHDMRYYDNYRLTLRGLALPTSVQAGVSYDNFLGILII